MKRVRIGATIVGILFGFANVAWALFTLVSNSMMHGPRTRMPELSPLLINIDLPKLTKVSRRSRDSGRNGMLPFSPGGYEANCLG